MKKMLVAVLVVFCNLITSIHVYSEENIATFSVAPIYSEHQSQGVNNFYDIVWTPSFDEEFAVKITNNTDEEQSYTISVNKARTNNNGIIDYSDSSPESEDAKYKLTEMIKLEEEVTLEANSSKIIEGKLLFPDEDFDGILMAGIYISQIIDTDEESTVSSLISYNIPFIVRGNIDVRPNPILTFSSLTIEKDDSDTSTFYITLDNQGPNLMKSVTISAEIVNESGETILTQERVIDVTPETIFSYPIETTSSIDYGKYNMLITVKHNENNEWTFQESFDIPSEANDNHNLDTMQTQKYQRVSVSILIGCIAILLTIITIKIKKSLK